MGAKADEIKNGKLVVRQGGLKLTSKLIKEEGKLLLAPRSGSMERMIKESLSCTAYYKMEEFGKTLFEFTSDQASFEYEFN